MRTRSASAVVAAYAGRFDRALSDGTHSISSPLGAWLLLALVAPAATGDEREELEAALGISADDAARLAHDLLRKPHRAVSAAVALWHRDEFLRPSFSEWMRTLGKVVETGRVPTQAEANQWADRATQGLIREFPADLDEQVAIVLANALATKVEWSTPFRVTPSAVLESPWADSVQRVLRADPDAHRMLIAHTETAGDVAVLAAASDDGLTVVSVIGDPEVAVADVRAAAQDAASLVVGVDTTAVKRSLFDLPLGDRPAWSVSEQRREADDPDETYTGYLPGWKASSDHDLLALDRDLGIAAACECLGQFVVGEVGFEAKQVATASYDRLGFEAAAITSSIARSLSATPMPEVQRHASLRFGHPYAVVAVATDRRGPWQAVPVFSAWVAEPAESGPE